MLLQTVADGLRTSGGARGPAEGLRGGSHGGAFILRCCGRAVMVDAQDVAVMLMIAGLLHASGRDMSPAGVDLRCSGLRGHEADLARESG